MHLTQAQNPWTTYPEKYPNPRYSCTVVITAAFIRKYSCAAASHVLTPSFHNVCSSSFNSWRYRLRTVPGCFAPCITIRIVIYFLFMPFQGGSLYMPPPAAQLLCVLI